VSEPRKTLSTSNSRPEASVLRSGAEWQAIEVRHLAALSAVASEASFRRAADRLGYVQSAISGQIAHLERVVGARLLTRASGTPVVELTAEGKVLLRHANEILARFETAQASVNSSAERSKAVVKVAGVEQLSPRQLATALSLFRNRHPFARVVLELPRPNIARGLAGIDVAICEPGDLPPRSTYELLVKDAYALLVSEHSGVVARQGRLTRAEFSQMRPMLPGAAGSSAELAHELKKLKVRRHPFLNPESVATASALVPYSLLDRADPGCHALDLSHLLPHRALLVARDEAAEAPPALSGFIQAAQEACTTLTGA
jgi:DNA-binding transcriptional LysR family regulator